MVEHGQADVVTMLGQTVEKARALYGAGEWAEAEHLCRSILDAQPGQFEALTLLGVIAARTHRTGIAVDLLGRAVALNPRDAAAHCNYGNALRDLGRLEAALDSYQTALQLKPDFAEIYYLRGNTLQDLGRSQEALGSYEQALRIRPDHAQAWHNHAVVLQHLKRFEAALSSYERALQIEPDYAYALSNRGVTLQQLQRFDAALESFEHALRVKPDFAEAYVNRGALFYERNQPEAAAASYSEAIALRPDLAAAYQSRAYARLLAGDFENGWLDHEWRWRNHEGPVARSYRELGRPLWLGGEPLADKTILLHSEQGLGDTLQFCRYAALVAQRGARVVLEVPASLASLLTSLQGVREVVARGEPLPAFDCHCPLMSLPLAFRTTLTTIPAQVPYLASDPAKVSWWQERLGERRNLRVGLVWSGGFRPHQPELWSVDGRRNIPLAKLAVLRHPHIDFHSLQKGRPAQSELAALVADGWQGPAVIDHADHLRDFSDTAALMENLDLIISVDTSTAHLAGALGKRVWIMNRFDTCWRWLLQRTDSPWYPTARLYRQDRAGEWEEVVERIRADLLRWVEEGRADSAPPVAEACQPRGSPRSPADVE